MSEPPADRPPTRWAQLKSSSAGAEYAARFAALAATGREVHGEALFCAGLLAPPATVLDAGCGTGRVAVKLAELGYRCTGIDLDPSMLAEARRAAPELDWVAGDLSSYHTDRRYRLIVAAGNVIALLAPGSLDRALVSLTALLSPDGLLVTGFGLDAGTPAGQLPGHPAGRVRRGSRGRRAAPGSPAGRLDRGRSGPRRSPGTR